MTAFFSYFVRHATAANLMMIVTVIAGLYAAVEIRKQFFPDIVIERITVRVVWSGAGPAEVDEAIIAALEPPLRAVEGVTDTRTLAREGLGSIVLEFEPGADMAAAVRDVEAAVDTVTTLPETAEDPTITRTNFRDRVTHVQISGDVPLFALSRIAEELRLALFREGVTRVTVRGSPAPQIRIEPDEAALRRWGLTFQDVVTAVQDVVVTRPAGSLGSDGARVRAGEERRSIEALRSVVVRAFDDGTRVTVGDVARLVDPTADPLGADNALALFASGRPAVELLVDRNAMGDAVRIQAQVEEIVAQAATRLPEGVEMQLTRTRAQAITDRLDLLVRNGLSGLAIVVLVLFLFLSARSALWVAAGIPTAMLTTILIMHISGVSLNMLSLFGLIICLGIVVDDAIVVSEHADHLARNGAPPPDAAANAAARMAAPVFSASVTTVLAFSALLAVSGRFGDLIVALPITVGVVLIASLIECFLILPAHMNHALSAQKRRSWIDAPSRAVNAGFDRFRRGAFTPIHRLAMRLRYPVVAGAIALLTSAVALQTSGSVRWFFFNPPERGVISANIAMAPGATREDTFAMLEEMRRALDVVNAAFAEEHGSEPVVDSLALLGGGAGRGLAAAETTDPDLLGGFQIELIDPDLRPYSQRDFIRAWRAEIVRHPLLGQLAMRGEFSGPGGDAIEVVISGDVSAETLKAASTALMERLRTLRGVSALEDSLAFDRDEFVLTLTPRGRALGFTIDGVATSLSARLEGVEAAAYPLGEQEATIRVQGAEETATRGRLEGFLVRSASGVTANLGDVVRIERRPSFASVRRLDGLRIVQINGEIIDDPVAREAVATALRDEILPEIETTFGVQTAQEGLSRQERDFLNDALIGFALCLLAIYATLAWILASWSRPLIILLAIPFGYVGAIWGHWIHGVPMSMFSVVGLIGMAGIIINDSIVLITTIDEKAKTRPIFEAVVEGAADRLRAVFLTTITTVGGLAPLLFETSLQALFLKPTVITLAYGLGFGMVIVLLVTPAMLLITHDVGRRVAAGRRLLGWALGGRRRRRAA